MSTITRETTFTIVDCPRCGMPFGITKDYESRRRQDKRDFVCPSGHTMSYGGESDKDKAQRLAGQLDLERSRLQQERQARISAEHAKDYAIRSRKAVSTRLKKVKHRVANGVCPCCNRTFKQLAAHMAGQHPEYDTQHEPVTP
jgi:hypothetical protein